MASELEQRVIELETRLAFQEDYMDTLNQQLVNQQKEWQSLQAQVQLLAQRLQTLHQDRQSDHSWSLADEKPPHY